MMSDAPTFLYRCVDSGERVYIHRFPVLKSTARGAWISDNLCNRWVSLHTVKRYAYPTKEEAIKGFAARKRRQITILGAQLDRARKASLIPSSEYLLCWL